jgi:dipeptidyl aminopeptidase/acylaminoacyl peptidase
VTSRALDLVERQHGPRRGTVAEDLLLARQRTRLVVYSTENHRILEPKNSEHWYGEVLGWLERYLKK